MPIVVFCSDRRGLRGLFAEAYFRYLPAFVRAAQRTGDSAARHAKVVTPVYNPLKYPSWAHMKNAHNVGGRLKASISGRKAYAMSDSRIIATVTARQPYASYVNDGFFHKRAGRHIVGRRFMDVGVTYALHVDAGRYIDSAVDWMFAQYGARP